MQLPFSYYKEIRRSSRIHPMIWSSSPQVIYQHENHKKGNLHDYRQAHHAELLSFGCQTMSECFEGSNDFKANKKESLRPFGFTSISWCRRCHLTCTTLKLHPTQISLRIKFSSGISVTYCWRHSNVFSRHRYRLVTRAGMIDSRTFRFFNHREINCLSGPRKFVKNLLLIRFRRCQDRRKLFN